LLRVGVLGPAVMWQALVRGRPATAAAIPVTPVDANPVDVTRTWLGPTYWGNRLQDWQLNRGRLECLGPARSGARTIAVLTREVVAGNSAASLTVRTGTMSAGAGFSGFLLGAGAGKVDYRSAALVQGASGAGGGIFCGYGSDGDVVFREHTSETAQLAYATLAATGRSGPAPARTLTEDVELQLDVAATGTGSFDLTLTALDFTTRALLSRATLRNLAGSTVQGGIALVSSTVGGATGARHWVRGLATGGAKIGQQPLRSLGPIIGTLYTVNGSVLKLTAQFAPVGPSEPQQAVLQYQAPGAPAWTTAATTTLGPGYTALFRVASWDATKTWSYRVAYALGTTREATYGGTIVADPSSKPTIVVGLLNCSIHSYRPLDVGSNSTPRLSGERSLGLYTDANLYFPYKTLTTNLAKHSPDLYVAMGDQFYEHRPTATDPSATPTLDFLYRYYLWLWAVRGLTSTRPTVVLVDDHDVYQGNVWGHEGAAAPGGNSSQGGYVRDPGWVNTVQRVQCGHNPDPFDPTPVLRGITVYYGMFRYGGVSFALLEDRKWKSGDADGLDASGQRYPDATAQLLGERQHTFLRAWATADAGLPKVCVSQTLFGCLQTTPAGAPFLDYDSNGYPAVRRRTAVTLLKQAKALVVSGDQHLASVVRHGSDAFRDGPVQFVAPAMGTAWQRWFEPAGTLPNGTGRPFTGDWSDGFGNRLSVLALANPKVSYATYRAGYPGTNQTLGDRALKSEGYGILRVQKGNSAFVLEAWPLQADPATGSTFPGWPVTVPFAQV
jgi:alkaline phosphatase D